MRSTAFLALGVSILIASAATAADCPKEEPKFAAELVKAVDRCRGDEDCQEKALQKCREELEKKSCDASRCDACPDDADQAIPGVCGCGSFGMFNTNGVGCTFCARALPGCELSCVGPPTSICEPQPECCAESPCAAGCPEENSIECTVSTCGCNAPECCSTVCPADEPCDKAAAKRAHDVLAQLRGCKDDAACEARVLSRCVGKLEKRGCPTNVCSEAAATAKRCEVEENKQAGEFSKALQQCRPGDERCSTDALARCTAAVEKRGCDAAACDACPDDAGKTLPGVCGCGYSDAPNTNGLGCTFCALNAPGCEFGCLAPPTCLCGGDAECCTDNPCCDDCPAPHPPQCFVNTCSCAPDTCCFTSCP